MTKGARLTPLILMALLSLTAAGPGQIIENASGPAARAAGRVLKLEEAWRIADDSGEFFFEHPAYFQVAEDGSIFLTDRDQVLRFSSEGKFLRNVLRLGDGPGEIKVVHGGAHVEIMIRGSELYIHDLGARRCWRADLDGRYRESLGTPKSGWVSLAGAVQEGLLFWAMDHPEPRTPGDPAYQITTGRYFDVPERLILATWVAGTLKDVFAVMNRTFVSPRTAQPDHLYWALSPDGRSLYFVLGSEYLVQELDLAAGAVVRKFRRPYQRVPTVEPKPMEGRFAKEFEEYLRKGWFPPRPPYVPDIQGLRFVGDELWVSTSTRDKAKGTLIDVFDREGRYMDRFYTGKNWGRAFEGFVLGTQTREDDTVVVVKYRIVK